MNNYVVSMFAIMMIAIVLSLIFEIAYIYTVLGLLSWSCVGHFITLDDDMPGEWDNPEGSKRIWYGSLSELLTKVLLLLVVGIAYIRFPSLSSYGS